MSIVADNPVFRREARWGRRLRRLRRNRPLAAMAALVALTVGWLYWQGLNRYADPETTYDNGGLWRLCSNVCLGLVVLLAPALASSAISQEKEQQTWEALAATRLTSAQVLVGKWLGRLVLVGWVTLLLAPLLLVSAAGAGLSGGDILGAFAFFALNAALYGMIGLVCSFVARRTLAATTVALVITAVLCLGTTILDRLASGMSQGVGDWTWMMRHSGLPSPLWLNPFYVLSLLSSRPEGFGGDFLSGYGAMSRETFLAVVTFYCVMALVVIALCLYYMFTRYRRAARGGRPLGESIS